ncbi:MAG: YCF48-related protein [Pseudomonadota bacterium]
MFSSNTNVRARTLAALCLLCGAQSSAHGQSPAAPSRVDLLSRPAVVTSRAGKAVLLTVARAGPRLVAAGERGIVLLSDDMGKSWRQTSVPVSVALTKLHFPDPGNGWAVGHGGVVLHSADGGVSWVKQLDGLQAAKIELAAASDLAQTGEAGKSRLRDAERLVAEGADKPLLDVYFSDRNRGWVLGAYGMALATVDGGQTWQSMRGRIPGLNGRHLYSVRAAGKYVYLAGEQGALYRSGDGGQTFDALATPYAGSYFGILSGNDGSLLLFGLRGNAYRSVDDGLHWRKIDTGLPVTLTAGLRLPSGVLILADETGRVLASRDNGASFAAMPVPQRATFSDLAPTADGGVVLAGARGPVLMAIESVNKEGSK